MRLDPGRFPLTPTHHFAGRINDEGAEALGEAERAVQVLEEDTQGLLQWLQVPISP